jgi:hypothetical protein
MANDTIKGAGDIYEKNLYGDLAKSAKDVIPLLEKINDTLQQTTKSNEKLINSEADTLKGIQDLNKGLEQTDKAYQQKLQLDKERLKLEDRLAKGRTEEAKENEVLKVQIQTQNKERKQAAKETLNLVGAYEKQSKRLNDLRKQYKNLIVEEGKATKATDELLSEIEKLDSQLKEVDASAGQFQRNVGDYPDTIGDATDSLLGFATAAVGAKLSVDGLTEALENTEEGSESLREVTSGLGGIWDQASNAASSFVLDVVDVGKGLADGEISALGLAKSIGLSAAGFGRFDKSATSSENLLKRTTEATDDFAAKAKASAEASIELEKRTIAFEKAIRPLEKRLTVLNGLIEEQGIIASDTTRTFDQIQFAILKGQELQIERASINVRIAQEELAIARESIRIKELAGGAGVELRDAEVEAVNNLIDAENELKNELLENDKELRQLKQDRLEKDLDILIDGFDNQKTINERIIGNEKETLERRAKLFEETTKLANQSFEGQKKVIEELSKAGVDVEDLLALDATELQKRIRQLEQSEIIEGRTLEVIRERRTVLQDLEDAQRDVNEAEQEGLDLRTDIIAQEEALFAIITGNAEDTAEALEQLEEQREQDNINNLIRRLDLEKDGSIAQLNIQKELNDALLEQQQNRINKEQEAEKAALEEEKKIAEQRAAIQDALLKKLEEVIIARSEKRVEELDAQADASEKNQDRLRELADKGSLQAQQSIAAETKKQAELQRAKDREERKQELVSAGFKIFSALLDQGKDPSAATIETATLLGALPAIIDAIPAFFDGTEDTGTVSKGLDSNGGRLAMLHDNERVISKKDNQKMGGISNEEAANIIQKYNMGELLNHNGNELAGGLVNSINLNGLNKGLERKIDTLNESIKSIKIPETTVNADELRNLLVIKKKIGNKIEIEKSKLH